MKIQTLEIGAITASYYISDQVIIKTPQDALELVANAPSSYLIFHEYNFEKEFFDLSTRIAGEILQKITNFRAKIAIIGKFENASESLKAFMYESNKHKEFLFVESLDEVKKMWSENE